MDGRRLMVASRLGPAFTRLSGFLVSRVRGVPRACFLITHSQKRVRHHSPSRFIPYIYIYIALALGPQFVGGLAPAPNIQMDGWQRRSSVLPSSRLCECGDYIPGRNGREYVGGWDVYEMGREG